MLVNSFACMNIGCSCRSQEKHVFRKRHENLFLPLLPTKTKLNKNKQHNTATNSSDFVNNTREQTALSCNVDTFPLLPRISTMAGKHLEALIPCCLLKTLWVYFDANAVLKLKFQLGIDVGSSSVARGVVSLVLGYLTNLVIEMAFVIQVRQLHYQGSSTSFIFFSNEPLKTKKLPKLPLSSENLQNVMTSSWNIWRQNLL